MTVSRRARTLSRLILLLSPVVVAACLGGRGTRRPAAPAVQPGRTDSTPPAAVLSPADSAARAIAAANAAAAARADSASRAADSIGKARAGDSSKADSVKPVAVRPVPKKPSKNCQLVIGQRPDTRFTFTRLADSSTNIMVGGGFEGHCEGEKNNVRADSAEYYETSGYLNLFGNVTYEEKPEFRVTSNHATYFLNEGKLYADGNVVATQLKTGSTFTGPIIEYFRIMPDVRTRSRLRAPNNPLVLMMQKDSTGKDLPPVRVSASEMQDNGDSVLHAWGNVAIQRSDIQGRGDSASFDNAKGIARLIRGANIQSMSKDQPFTLTADTIDMFTTDSVLDRVFAKHTARAKQSDMNMSAERLDIRLVDRKINRAYAFGTGRAKTDTKDRSLEADSIDIVIPNQLLKELRAFGTAIVISKPDSTKIKSDENDVLKANVIIAEFDSVRGAKDTTAKVQISRVTANGEASSKVQIASRQGPSFPPAINYIRGKHLIVTFDSGQVKEIAVDSSASGQYFEPVADSTGDSTARNRPRRPPSTASRVILKPDPRRNAPARPLPAAQTFSLALIPSRTFRTR